MSRSSELDKLRQSQDLIALVLVFFTFFVLQAALALESWSLGLLIYGLSCMSYLSAILLIARGNRKLMKHCYMPQLYAATIVAGLAVMSKYSQLVSEWYLLGAAGAAALYGVVYVTVHRKDLRWIHWGVAMTPILMLNWLEAPSA